MAAKWERRPIVWKIVFIWSNYTQIFLLFILFLSLSLSYWKWVTLFLYLCLSLFLFLYLSLFLHLYLSIFLYLCTTSLTPTFKTLQESVYDERVCTYLHFALRDSQRYLILGFRRRRRRLWHLHPNFASNEYQSEQIKQVAVGLMIGNSKASNTWL